jgi:hypothetical protein
MRRLRAIGSEIRYQLFMWLLTAIGCKSSALTFTCRMDAQCGVGGSCVAGGCAFIDAACPSGYRWDKSASGQCTPVGDMATIAPADMADAVDMAQPVVYDLAPPIVYDMVLTCANVGGPCTVGVGACARTGTVACSSPGMATCSATAGSPDTSGTWHQAAAVNGSWDWDCDGYVEYQYPSGDTTPPPLDQPAIGTCASVGDQSVCNAPHWYYAYEHSYGLPSCGHPIDDMLCFWQTSGGTAGCIDSGGTSTTQGCR